MRTRILNVNQTFRGYSLFISGLKATEKKKKFGSLLQQFQIIQLDIANQALSTPTHVTKDFANLQFRPSFAPNIVKVQASF